MTIEQFKIEEDNIWSDFYEGACPTGEQRDYALEMLKKKFNKEFKLS